MSNLVWYTGIAVNFLIVLILFYFLFRLVGLSKRGDNTGIYWSILLITGLIVTASGTLALYLQMNIVQTYITDLDTFFPLLLWMGYYIVVTAFVGKIASYSNWNIRHRILIQIIVVIFLVIAARGMFEYLVTWNNGAVLVEFINIQSDNLGMSIAFLVSGIGLYVSITCRIDLVTNQEINITNIQEKGSKNFLYATICFALQFIIPRVGVDSITNPVSVKIVGFIVIVSFAYFLMMLDLSNTDNKQSQKIYEKIEISNYDIASVFLVVSLIAIYNILINQEMAILSVSEKIEHSIPIVFIGNLGEYAVYLDFWGCILPCIFSIAFIILGILLDTDVRRSLRNYLPVLLLSGGLGYNLSIIVTLGNTASSVLEALRIDILPFIVAPIISLLIVEHINKKRFGTSFGAQLIQKMRNPLFLVSFCVVLYSVTYFAAFAFDITIATSPFGIIQFGAAGIADGLFWAPILSSGIFAIFVLLCDNLRLL